NGYVLMRAVLQMRDRPLVKMKFKTPRTRNPFHRWPSAADFQTRVCQFWVHAIDGTARASMRQSPESQTRKRRAGWWPGFAYTNLLRCFGQARGSKLLSKSS